MPILHDRRFHRSHRHLAALTSMAVLGASVTLFTQGFVVSGPALAQANPAAVQQSQPAPGTCSPNAIAVPQDCVARLEARANPTLGTIMTDQRGNTLYYYDEPTSAAAQDPLSCPYGPNLGRGGAGRVATCLSAWPPLITDGTPPTPEGLSGTLGMVVRPDLHNIYQVTYNGALLYYFVGDQTAGDTNGQGVVAFGGTWQVVTVGD